MQGGNLGSGVGRGGQSVAGLSGFVGKAAAAMFRIRVGRAIGSPARIADGCTNLAVVPGGVRVRAGFPRAGPITGLLITDASFGIVWHSARAVLTRMPGRAGLNSAGTH